jgi:PII-like signaling protein
MWAEKCLKSEGKDAMVQRLRLATVAGAALVLTLSGCGHSHHHVVHHHVVHHHVVHHHVVRHH